MASDGLGYLHLSQIFNYRNGILLSLSLLLFAPIVQAQDDAWIDLQKQDGAALFNEKCGMCHKAGGMGSGILARRLQGDQSLLESRVDLTAEFIDTVVRSGFGLMYPMSRGEVSDEQLNTIKQLLVKE
jgi:mono/diheme cytochrome c family protein